VTAPAAGSYTAAVPVYIDRDPEARRLEAEWRASMTPRKLSRVVTAEMRERYESGLSLECVAEQFGVTRQSVYDRFVRAGVTPANGGTMTEGSFADHIMGGPEIEL
jgi:transcriptional regulator GlxA family with amidase domain